MPPSGLRQRGRRKLHLGHTNIRTTQIYAYLAPAAVQRTATLADAAFVSATAALAKAIPVGGHALAGRDAQACEV